LLKAENPSSPHLQNRQLASASPRNHHPQTPKKLVRVDYTRQSLKSAGDRWRALMKNNDFSSQMVSKVSTNFLKRTFEKHT
jgi:hypothetical protein